MTSNISFATDVQPTHFSIALIYNVTIVLNRPNRAQGPAWLSKMVTGHLRLRLTPLLPFAKIILNSAEANR